GEYGILHSNRYCPSRSGAMTRQSVRPHQDPQDCIPGIQPCGSLLLSTLLLLNLPGRIAVSRFFVRLAVSFLGSSIRRNVALLAARCGGEANALRAVPGALPIGSFSSVPRPPTNAAIFLAPGFDRFISPDAGGFAHSFRPRFSLTKVFQYMLQWVPGS